MTEPRELVAQALEAVEIDLDLSFTWLGVRHAPAYGSRSTSQAVRRGLTVALAARLYDSFYATGGVVGPDADPPPPWADPAFAARLRAAAGGGRSRQPGWRVISSAPGAMVATRDGVRVRFSEDELLAGDGGLRAGAAVELACPRVLPAWSPGFITVLGKRDLVPGGAMLARLYFDLPAGGAAAVVAALCAALDGSDVPFRLKAADRPAGFQRCDAAVLYLSAADLRGRRKALAGAVAACRAHLRAGRPVFTKALAPGVGFGEERPGTPESFGMRRCRLVAEAIVAAHAAGTTTLDGRLLHVARRFAAAGLDLDAPYLERGSVDDYAL